MGCYYGDTHQLMFVYSMQIRCKWSTLQVGPFNTAGESASQWHGLTLGGAVIKPQTENQSNTLFAEYL